MSQGWRFVSNARMNAEKSRSSMFAEKLVNCRLHVHPGRQWESARRGGRFFYRQPTEMLLKFLLHGRSTRQHPQRLSDHLLSLKRIVTS